MKENKNVHRFPEIDIWRGVAIIGMVIFHIVFLLDFMGIRAMAYDEGWWRILARLVQWSFLLLVGISLNLSFQGTIRKGGDKTVFLFKSLQRALIILGYAAIVSLITFIVTPGQFIRFGILHHIGISIIILAPLVNRPKTCLLISMAIYFLTPLVTSFVFMDSPLLALGIHDRFFASIDYFPIFPWMSIPALGVYISYIFYRQEHKMTVWFQQIFSHQAMRPIKRAGKHSLLIYMTHVPIIILILYIWETWTG